MSRAWPYFILSVPYHFSFLQSSCHKSTKQAGINDFFQSIESHKLKERKGDHRVCRKTDKKVMKEWGRESNKHTS